MRAPGSSGMTRYFNLVMPALLALAAALIGPPAHAADKVKVSYPTPTSSYIFFFGAIQKGYYKDEGLDLDVIEAGGGVATPALVSGDVAVQHVRLLRHQRHHARRQAQGAGGRRGPAELADVDHQARDQDLPGTQGTAGGHSQPRRYRRGRDPLPAQEIWLAAGFPVLHPHGVVARHPHGGGAGGLALPAAVLQPAEVETLRAGGGLANAHMVVDWRRRCAPPSMDRRPPTT